MKCPPLSPFFYQKGEMSFSLHQKTVSIHAYQLTWAKLIELKLN